MSVVGEDFLKFSENLLNHSSTEIEYRNVISRLYYSLIHVTGRCLAPSAPKKYHTEMERYLKTPDRHDPNELIPSSELKALGELLAARRAKRVVADYRLEEDVMRADADGEMEISKLIHQKLHAYQLQEKGISSSQEIQYGKLSKES